MYDAIQFYSMAATNIFLMAFGSYYMVAGVNNYLASPATLESVYGIDLSLR